MQSLDPGPARAAPPSRDALRCLAGAAVLVAAIFLAYLPALHGGPVWDDDYMLTGTPVMTDPHGLYRIWFDLSAVQVYYPLTLATLWVESRLFGLTDLTGYHVVNVLLHAANAILLWRLLRRLEVRGAFAAAALWGLHPVGIESVAWITEHKNTLSGLFYLGSLWALLRYFDVIQPPPRQPRRWYLAALLAFGLALAAKTTAGTLPAAALLLVWWKTGQLQLRHVRAVVPFLLLAAAAGSLTQYVEVHTTGIWNAQWSLTAPQKILVAGRALCFYAAKLAWPARLSFVYPRWQVDPGAAWQWAFPLTVVAVLAGLWAGRRRLGRGPLVGVLFFAGTLVPALGFFHVLFQRYSFVADHFQYLAGVGLIAVVVGAAARLPVSRGLKGAVFVALAVTAGALTARSAGRFTSDEAIWAAVLPMDPASPIANLNYASDLITRGAYDQAMPYLRRYAASEQMTGLLFANLGRIAEARQQYPQALADYQRAVQLEPDDPHTRFQFGNMLLITGRPAEAAEQLQRAVDEKPEWAEAHDNLGVCLLHLGDPASAGREFRLAAQLKPDLPLVQRHLRQAGQ